jgi:site-specific DNA recombinase
MQEHYRVGLYLRLSRDDNNSESESMSISNQRNLLTDYVKERGWETEEIYIDDGISGVTFDRPAFNRLIKDIENERINMVITKDLSRLGRNYLKVGEYTDYFFPEHKVRYIAVNDNYDNDKEDDFVAFRNIFNEHYAKDTSKKIKSVKKSQMKQGLFIGSQPAMGYKRDPDNKHKLIIDEEAVEIIRRIFHRYSIGDSARHIAETFNQEGVPTPREYFFNRIGKPNPYTSDAVSWGSSTIIRMLGNQVYIGHMCQGKRQKKSFKMKRRDVIPQEEWIVIEDTHEPIIDELTWDRVHTILKRNKSSAKPRLRGDKTIALFSGKVRCADCQAVMTYTYSKNTVYKAYYKYRCSTYSNQGKTACSYHAILEDELETIVLAEIQKFSKIASCYEDELMKKLIDINSNIKLKNNSFLEKQIRRTNREFQGIAPKIDVLINQMANGNISEQMFKKLMSQYEQKQNDLSERLAEQKAELSRIKDDIGNIKHLVECFRERVYIEDLDRETVVELIDYIEVSKKEKVGTEYMQRVDIHFNFVGQITTDNFQALKDYVGQREEENQAQKMRAV